MKQFKEKQNNIRKILKENKISYKNILAYGHINNPVCDFHINNKDVEIVKKLFNVIYIIKMNNISTITVK